MAHITFLGAAGGVTGSGYLLELNDVKLLIDFGMFQGLDDSDALNRAPLSFNPSELTGVFLTHAHLDHCGRLPLLIKKGFTGKIYMTPATKDITHVSLLDAAGLMEGNKKEIPLYTKDDVEKTIARVATIEYDEPLSVRDATVTFRDAGHILGSASIEISHDGKVIVFSGDLGNTPEELIKPTEYIQKADTIIMESTYGNSLHRVENARDVIQKEIETIEKTGGVLLIPAFSIERTQEVIHLLGHLRADKKINASIPVFLDSPMAIAVTEIFKKYHNLYSAELAKDISPFGFENLLLTESTAESKAITKAFSPKIIIAGSGMMSGGRILHHLEEYISDPRTRLLVVGYQAEGTLGHAILNGAKKIHLYKKEVPVKATITRLEAFSSHADESKLLDWLKHIAGVGTVFLTHGEDLQRQALSDAIKKELKIEKVILPIRDKKEILYL